MRDINDLKEEAEHLMELILMFNFQAGLIDSMLALRLRDLQYSLQAILDHIQDVAQYEEDID